MPPATISGPTERTPRRFTVTGAPGAGKTTTLNLLAARGIAVVPEVARAYIRDRIARGLSPRPSPPAFAEALIALELQALERPLDAITALHDRGIVDALALAVGAGARSMTAVRQTLAQLQPVQPILLFRPWAEIYRTDAERDQTFTEAVSGYEAMLRFLDRTNLDGLEVPIGPAEARADFIEAAVRNQTPGR